MKTNEFNHKDTLLLVTVYPKKDELYSEGTSGVAMYTKNIVSRMQKKAIILADIYNKEETYREKNALVVRCFDAKKFSMWLQILKALGRYPEVKRIMVQFDFAIYHNLYNSALVLPFLLYLKLRGYETVVVNHHIVIDIRKLAGHVGLGENIADTIRAHILNAFFHLFYISLGFVTDKVVVLEETLKQSLTSFIPTKKIVVIPIGVDTNLKAVDKATSRKRLGIPENAVVILYFGFLNWFKGADFFARTFARKTTLFNKPLHAILAGGASPTQGKKSHYKKYFEKITKTIQASSSTRITGYVPQEKIADYFSAADVVVLPYRHYMTASGVLSLVFSYKTPFVVSEDLLEMMQSTDFIDAMKRANLTHDDMAFSLNTTSCISAISHALRPATQAKMKKFTKLIQQKRNYQQSAYSYESLFQTKTKSVTSVLLDPTVAEAHSL